MRVLCAVLLAMLCSAPAAAAAEWETPQVLTPRGEISSSQPHVAAEADGDVVVVYTRTPTRLDDNSWKLHQARRPAAGPWEVDLNPISTLDRATPPGLDPSDIAMTLDGQGNGALAWIRNLDSGRQLWAMLRNGSGATWYGERQMSGLYDCPTSPASKDRLPQAPVVTMTPEAKGHVIWGGNCENASSGGPTQYPVLTRPFTFTDFAPIAKIGSLTANVSPVGYGLPDGTSRFLYVRQQTGLLTADVVDGATVLEAERSEQFEPLGGGSEARIAPLPNGEEVAVWRRFTSPSSIWARITGQPPVRVSPEGEGAFVPRLAVGADGTVVVAWTSTQGFRASVRPPGGAFGPAHDLSGDVEELEDLVLAVSPNGVAYAAWRHFDGQFDVLEAARMDPLDPTVSPGAPYQFQPVPDLVSTQVIDDDENHSDVDRIGLAVSPQNVAHLVFSAVYNANPPRPRFALMATRLVGRAPGENPPNGTKPDPTPPGPPPTDNVIDPDVPGPPPPPPPPPVAGDTTPPLIGRINLTRSLFGVGRTEGMVLSKKGKRTIARLRPNHPLKAGTRIRFTLSEPASVIVTITHRGCWANVTVIKQEDRKGREGEDTDKSYCSRRRVDGVVHTMRLTGRTGRNTVVFTGRRMSRKPLRPTGVYRVDVDAFDGAGNPAERLGPLFKVDAPR